MSKEKKATAPKTGEVQPASRPIAVDNAHTEAACADGIPPIPVSRVKSSRLDRSAAKPNLNNCAESRAISAKTNGGFHAMTPINLLAVAFDGESSEAFQFGCAQLGRTQRIQRVVDLAGGTFGGAFAAEQRG